MATAVEGDPRLPFSAATTPKCGWGCYSFPWIAPIYPWYVPYKAEEVSSTIFKSLVWLDQGLNPNLPDHRRTLKPLCQSAGTVLLYAAVIIPSLFFLTFFESYCYIRAIFTRPVLFLLLFLTHIMYLTSL